MKQTFSDSESQDEHDLEFNQLFHFKEIENIAIWYYYDCIATLIDRTVYFYWIATWIWGRTIRCRTHLNILFLETVISRSPFFLTLKPLSLELPCVNAFKTFTHSLYSCTFSMVTNDAEIKQASNKAMFLKNCIKFNRPVICMTILFCWLWYCLLLNAATAWYIFIALPYYLWIFFCVFFGIHYY